MSNPSHSTTNVTPNRRDFLKSGTAAALGGSLLASLNSGAYASQGSGVLRVGLIGCGGRGTGAAAQALTADPQTELVAMGDTFADQIEKSQKTLAAQPIGNRVKVGPEGKFVGFDAYKGVIASSDVVLLTTSPHFRPEHLQAAVEAGKHCFVEKPVAVDAKGVRSVLETCELAEQKGLSIVSGLCWRYHYGMREVFARIHDGMIGDIVALQCTYNTQGLWHRGRDENWSDMEYQMRNWLYFTWLSGDHITEQHVHSLDKMAWAMNDEPPVRCTANGGRQVRVEKKWGNIYDHFNCTFEYAGDVKGFTSCRQLDGCSKDTSDHIIGTKGVAHVLDLRKGHPIRDHAGKLLWRYEGKSRNMYQIEHDEFFASIRSGKPINNGKYMCTSTLLAILGRTAAYTGKTITWDQIMNSQLDLSPPSYDWIDLPVRPVALPGVTEFV
jgi:predicted dehydrogenase